MALTTEAASELVHELASALRPMRSIATGLDIDGLPWTLQVLLLRIQNLNDCRPQDLSEQFGISASVLSRQVSDLVEAQLIERNTDPEDGRAQRLTLTAAGHGTAQRIRSARIARLQSLLPDWTDTQALELAASLRQLGQAMLTNRNTAPQYKPQPAEQT